MNKNKIIAALLALGIAVCSLTACGDAKEPGTKNDKLIEKTPETLEIVDKDSKADSEEVTAITAATDINGKVIDNKGITDKAGHRIYSTGQKDSYGKLIYTTGKKASDGSILYTKNEVDSLGNMIYYKGKYNSDGSLSLTRTAETPDYSSNEVPSTKQSSTIMTTSTTVGVKDSSDKKVSESECSYTKYFGGSGLDAFRDITACKDGGYITAGISASTDGEYKGVSGDWDGQHTALVKYSADGNVEWKYIVGGDGDINFNDVVQLKDDTFVAAGQTIAKSGDIVKNAGTVSSFIVRLKTDGSVMWKYVFPSDENSMGEYISSLAATPDGGFVAGGKAVSESGFFNGTRKGGTKAFIFKFDKNCNIQWRKILEGSKSNNFSALAVNSDGDIFGTCVTMSSDGDFSGIRFNKVQASNTVLVKLNKKGNLQWFKYLEGSGDSEFDSIVATDDGGCAVAGFFTIYKKADGIYNMNYGKRDGYVLRYDSKGQVCWSRIIGGGDHDSVNAIAKVEGGFVVVGQTQSKDGDFQGFKAGGEGDGYIMYLNEQGKTSKVIRLNGKEDDSVMDVAVLNDGSVAVAGWTKSSDQAFEKSNAKKQYMGYVSRYTVTVK